jgi:uncharacterized membrane protein
MDSASLYVGRSPRERAIEVFSLLRLWDTDHRNAVLIYVLLADRAVEIIADRGVQAKIPNSEWESICHEMELAFSQELYRAAVVDGIRAVTRHLTAHFPLIAGTTKELPDKPVVL